MSLRVAIQMDPVESIDIRGDTSFALGLEAQNRGHELHYYLPDSLTLADGRPKAVCRTLALCDNQLSGPIPNTLCACTALQKVVLGDNQI